jgi:hypothetical protein
MHMLMPRPQQDHRRLVFVGACCSLPATWTLGMTILALAVRY